MREQVDLTAARDRIQQGLALLRDREAKKVSIETALQTQQDLQKTLTECLVLLQGFYAHVQKIRVGGLEQFVTQCLDAVFGAEAYQFRIKYEQKRSQTEASFVFLRNGQEYDPAEACGGGCLDVTVFALRLGVLLFSPTKPRRLMILDEPFRYVSSEYRKNLISLIETLAQKHSVQFILVTHADDLAELGTCGNLVRLS